MVKHHDSLSEPNNIKEALASPNRKEWIEAITSELDSISKNDVWTIVDRPKDKTVIGTRWVFKVKRNADNKPERYKARLVAKGYSQEYGIDYYETFAPVVKIQTLRTLFAIAAQKDLIVHQIDIDTAFLNGELEEETYVEPPPGITKFDENKVCKLKRSLYGLKQAPRAWNKALVNFLSEFGLKQLKSDVCLFVNESIIIAIYVDDIIITSKHLDQIVEFKNKILNKFKAKDLGEVKFVLKINIEKVPGGGWKLHQQNYIDELIQFYEMKNEKTVAIPIQPNHKLTVDLVEEKEPLRKLIDSSQYRQAIGKIMYLMICSRPDICYAVTVLSRFMSKPREKHWRHVKQLLRYIKSTRNYALIYPKLSSMQLIGYSDSDHAGDLGDRKSTLGFIFILSGCTISWRSLRQKAVAISFTEAEYIAMSGAAQEALWLKTILCELGMPQNEVVMCGDNLSSMQIIRNPISHHRSKHIDVRYHFIRDHYKNGNLDLKYIKSEDLCSDFMTKGVDKVKHFKCIKAINLIN